MSFLSPLYLLLAGAAAVPLLLHLLRRRIGTRVEFPAARYIARAERENSRKLRLRNLLLMVLRVVAVLLIAAAAARPVGRLVGTGHVPTALAIVVDNSLSTTVVVDGAPLFTRLRRAALTLARRSSPSDRLWLVTADGRVIGGSRSAVANAIETLDPLAGRGDVEAAVARAAGLVRAAGLTAQRVAIVTDAQATTWQADLDLGDLPVSVYAPSGAPPANHAVTEAAARPVRWTPRGAVVARTLGADSATYRIALGGAANARTLARGTAVAGQEIVVRAAPPERGWVAGTVELEPDELRGDDVRHFAVSIGVAPAVALDPALGPFAKSAVDALIQSERLRPGSDVLVASGEGLTRLPALIVAPTDPVRVGAANRALERAGVPWRFGAPRRDPSAVRADSADSALFGGVTTALRYPLVAAGAAVSDTIALAGGDPWIVAGDRYVIIGSPLDPAATTFPVRAGFLPWLGDVVAQRLSGDAGILVEAPPGARVRLATQAQAIEDGAGQRLPLDPGALRAPDRPGVYFLIRGESRVGALVVNAEPEESALGRLDAAALRGRLRSRELAVSSVETSWLADAFSAGARRPLTTPLLALALAALIAESMLARGARPTARAA